MRTFPHMEIMIPSRYIWRNSKQTADYVVMQQLPTLRGCPRWSPLQLLIYFNFQISHTHTHRRNGLACKTHPHSFDFPTIADASQRAGTDLGTHEKTPEKGQFNLPISQKSAGHSKPVWKDTGHARTHHCPGNIPKKFQLFIIPGKKPHLHSF